MGLRKNGKYAADVMHRYSDRQDFSRTEYINLEGVNVTDSGALMLTRLRDGGEHDGSTETMVLIARGMWSQVTATLQDAEEEAA